MKILQIIYSLSDTCGGPIIGVKNLARALVSYGHEVTVCGTNKRIKKTRDTSVHGCKIYEFPTEKFHKYYYSPKMGAFLKKTITEYDVVHIHGIWTYPTHIASRISRINNIPYIVRTCGMLEQWSLSQKIIKKLIYFHLIEKHNLKRASFIQFSTEIESEKSVYKKWNNQNLKYISNILSFDEIDKTNMELDKRLINKKYILFFGRLCYQKGLDILIEAYNLLQKNTLYNDIYLVLMGSDDDNYFEKLKKKRPHIKAWDKIINIGMVYGAERFSIVKQALFMCLPSRQENLGLCMLETLACGIPVLISTSIDMAHLIEKGHLGKVCSLDPVHLELTMKEMIDIDTERIVMGQNGKNFVRRRFNIQDILSKYINMYEESITKRSIKTL